MGEKKMTRDSITTTVVNFFAQFGNFLVSAVIAALYGATKNTDVYFYALALVLIVTSAITGVLKSVFTPVFLRFLNKEEAHEKEVLGSFYFYFFLFLFFIWSVFVLLSQGAIRLVSIPGIENVPLLSKILFELSFVIFFVGIVECFSTVYNSYQNFLAPLITPLLRSTFFIVFVVLFIDRLGVHSLSLGTLIAEGLHAVIFLAILKYKKIYFGLSLKLHPAVKQMAKISLPPFLSNATTRINNFIDSSFIAPLLVGGVTVLNYANKVSSIPEMLLTGGFLTVILSYWSLKRSKEGSDSLSKSLKNALLAVSFVVTPIICYMFVLKTPLVSFLYQRRNFTEELTGNTAMLLGFYSIGILPLVLGRVLTRAFLALEDTWTPFWVGNIRAILNIGFNFLLIKLFGFLGVALSSSVTSLLMFLFMYKKITAKIEFKESFKTLGEITKVLFLGILSSIPISLVFNFSYQLVIKYFNSFLSLFLSLSFSSIFSLCLYIVLCYIFKVEIVNLIQKVVKSKLPFFKNENLHF